MTIPNYRDQIKVIFFDIDETLFMKEQDHLPASVPLFIRKLKQNGIIPAIASGRSRTMFPWQVKQLVEQEGMALFVTMNGQSVTHKNQVIAKHTIPTEQIRRLTYFFDQHHIAYAFITDDAVNVSEKNARVTSSFDVITTDYAVDKAFFERHAISQILPFYREEQDQLVQNCGLLDGLRMVRWHEESVDLFDAEGSKARGIETAVKHLGLSMENVMAFGDGLNDLEMLSRVGVGVAMGNGHEKLKAIADHVADPIDQDGIYRFLVKAGLID
ncbi:Cof-type HAD-IIB family hydrolase [Aggregatibacter actinomycetemcomitans]|uniref:Cof-type HAD-IIB family hydrolase n=1 Tax=Aggregatibacter actinomycetemcomitans TaxID=714 RepID=UPI00022AC6F4|nr:Cof-type HAD-IIB family hydrolase [Aggregatibacter actinomycetemcomitans]AEW76829.1 Cof protein [Aggregatibacter actinomycetemcomitans ANH9381]AHN71627.1 hypothetical protein CF65_01216 [Aggregatibacter actinomycetemcomitans HK1651]AMQ92549.1 hydrolase [Aggregatibacter actinomycetemcomitans]KND83965.1 hydrolase [Aggregatibacter actinomycetemcomitans serotype b str. SCC1398]KOE55709.1 hydrolase [Aggregatibacter actinomycetemcomitans serotype b str. S23A]